jgi:hypothetical protein
MSGRGKGRRVGSAFWAAHTTLLSKGRSIESTNQSVLLVYIVHSRRSAERNGQRGLHQLRLDLVFNRYYWKAEGAYINATQESTSEMPESFCFLPGVVCAATGSEWVLGGMGVGCWRASCDRGTGGGGQGGGRGGGRSRREKRTFKEQQPYERTNDAMRGGACAANIFIGVVRAVCRPFIFLSVFLLMLLNENAQVPTDRNDDASKQPSSSQVPVPFSPLFRHTGRFS